MDGWAPRAAAMDAFPTPDNMDAGLSSSGQAKSTQWTVWAGLTGAPDVCGFTMYFCFIYPMSKSQGKEEVVLQPSIFESHRKQYSFPPMSVMFAILPYLHPLFLWLQQDEVTEPQTKASG